MGKIIDRVRGRERVIIQRRVREMHERWEREVHASNQRQLEAQFRAMRPVTYALTYGVHDRVAAGLPWWAFWRSL